MTDSTFYDKIHSIKELTDQNDHTGACILGSELIGAKVLAEKFRLLEKMRDLENGMDSAMSEFRYALYKDLMNKARIHLQENEYSAFYGSY